MRLHIKLGVDSISGKIETGLSSEEGEHRKS